MQCQLIQWKKSLGSLWAATPHNPSWLQSCGLSAWITEPLVRITERFISSPTFNFVVKSFFVMTIYHVSEYSNSHFFITSSIELSPLNLVWKYLTVKLGLNLLLAAKFVTIQISKISEVQHRGVGEFLHRGKIQERTTLKIHCRTFNRFKPTKQKLST